VELANSKFFTVGVPILFVELLTSVIWDIPEELRRE
jgi:hypothetical protein